MNVTPVLFFALLERKHHPNIRLKRPQLYTLSNNLPINFLRFSFPFNYSFSNIINIMLNSNKKSKEKAPRNLPRGSLFSQLINGIIQRPMPWLHPSSSASHKGSSEDASDRQKAVLRMRSLRMADPGADILWIHPSACCSARFQPCWHQ